MPLPKKLLIALVAILQLDLVFGVGANDPA